MCNAEDWCDPWVGKIPWRRKSHGQKSLEVHGLAIVWHDLVTTTTNWLAESVVPNSQSPNSLHMCVKHAWKLTTCQIKHVSYTKSQWPKSCIINYDLWPQQIILGNSQKKITTKSQCVWKLVNACLNNLSVQKEVNNWNCFELSDHGNTKFGDAN